MGGKGRLHMLRGGIVTVPSRNSLGNWLMGWLSRSLIIFLVLMANVLGALLGGDVLSGVLRYR